MADLIDKLHTGILVLDQSYHISDMNQAAEKILGWDRETLNSKLEDLSQLSISLKSFQKFIKDLKNNELNESRNRFEISINGYYYNLYLLKNETSNVLELSQIIYQDMKQTTHELKRPIQNIKTLVETLEMGAKNDEAKRDEYLEKLNFEADRLGSMVSDLLSLSHVTSGVLEIHKEKFGLKERINRLLDTASSRANDRQVELENLIQEDFGLEADMKLFDHMFANLIDNAIKYNRASGKVTVSSENNAITVADTGIGIPSENLEEVFDQFFRVDHASQVKGSGIGLSIVKAIADLHGWNIDIQSEVNIGTKFIVNI